MTTYIPIGHDNRGTPEAPFGYVYLARSKRGNSIGRLGYGPSRDNPDPLAVWPTSDTPADLSRGTIYQARAYLARQWPDLVRDRVPCASPP